MKPASEKLLQKSLLSIEAAEELYQSKKYAFSISRAYYAMFYIAEALLYEKGLSFKKHGAVHAAFGEHFAKKKELDPKYHGWLLEAFGNRISSDYDIEAVLSAEDAKLTIDQAREFLEVVRQYLSQKQD